MKEICRQAKKGDDGCDSVCRACLHTCGEDLVRDRTGREDVAPSKGGAEIEAESAWLCDVVPKTSVSWWRCSALRLLWVQHSASYLYVSRVPYP